MAEKGKRKTQTEILSELVASRGGTASDVEMALRQVPGVMDVLADENLISNG
jgi:hypothetical protein